MWKELRSDVDDLNKRMQYRTCTNELRAKTRLLMEQRETNVIQANNIGLFYKYINSRIAYRKPIGTLLDDNGNAVTSDQSKADMFNNYYDKAD